MKNYPLMKDSELLVQVVTDQYQDEYGTIHKRFKWQKLDAPVSLGSIAQPQNKQIIGFQVKSIDQLDIRSFMDKMFG